jgi:hypothetical protein
VIDDHQFSSGDSRPLNTRQILAEHSALCGELLLWNVAEVIDLRMLLSSGEVFVTMPGKLNPSLLERIHKSSIEESPKITKIDFVISSKVFGGWGRDRTVDLTIFSRALIPTELPSQQFLV